MESRLVHISAGSVLLKDEKSGKEFPAGKQVSEEAKPEANRFEIWIGNNIQGAPLKKFNKREKDMFIY